MQKDPFNSEDIGKRAGQMIKASAAVALISGIIALVFCGVIIWAIIKVVMHFVG